MSCVCIRISDSCSMVVLMEYINAAIICVICDARLNDPTSCMLEITRKRLTAEKYLSAMLFGWTWEKREYERVWIQSHMDVLVSGLWRAW